MISPPPDPNAADFTPQTSEPPTADESSEQDPPLWSPVIEGETVGIEITLPSSAALSTFSLFVDQVSHILQSISAPQYEPQALRNIGNARCSSHIDVQCRDVEATASATAKMVYIRAGGSYLCTGTLVTDADDSSFIPYFLTAHHCISTQAVARTLVTYWDFERTRCDGPAPARPTQLAGGADLLATHSLSDSTLLRLREDPPSTNGRWYLGWSSGSLTHPQAFYGVHHPAGDLKKYGTGTTTHDQLILLGEQRQRVQAINVRWSQGASEGGSSGSGLFDGAGRLRGVLSGSSTRGCDSETVYGRFDLFFRYARYWLASDTPVTAPTDDHGDTSAQATRVAPGSSTSGNLEQPGGDIDYFQFELPGAGTLTVFTTGDTDTYGELILPGGDSYEHDDIDYSGGNLNFRIERRAASSGVYYVSVRGYSTRTTGPYTLVVRFTPSTSLDDHGDDTVSATRVDPGSSTSGYLEQPGDRDYFRIEVSVPGTLTVYTTGGTDTLGELIGAHDEVEDDDSGAGLNFYIERRAASSGVYYVSVRGYSTRTTGPYTLVVRFTPSTSSDDHGDTRAQATRVAPGSSITSGNLEQPGDADYFRLELPDGGLGGLAVYTTGDTDTVGQLFLPGGEIIENDDSAVGNYNFRIARGVWGGSSDVYYVRVTGYQGTTGPYTLVVSYTTWDGITHVVPGSSISGNLERPGDAHYFFLQLPGAGSLAVYTTGDTDTVGELTLSGLGIHNNAEILESDDDSGVGNNFRIEWEAASSGRYYVTVTGYAGATGPYTLVVRFHR